MFTIDYVNNTIWTPTLRDDYSCHPLRMCPTEGTTRYDRASRSVILLRFHTSLDQKKRFLLHARKEKPNCHRDKNGREVQVGLVTQLVVELNLLETGRKTFSRSFKRERARAHVTSCPVGEVRRLGVELNLLETGRKISFSFPYTGKRSYSRLDYSKHETPLWGNLEWPSLPRTCKLTV